MLRKAALPLLVAAILAGCSGERGRTTQMVPDCTQASAEQQRAGKCVYRPDPPGDMSR